MLLTEIISTVPRLASTSLHVTEFTLGSDQAQDKAPPGLQREVGGTWGWEGTTTRWSSERGERPLIKGNIREPEGSYVNGSVIKAL